MTLVFSTPRRASRSTLSLQVRIVVRVGHFERRDLSSAEALTIPGRCTMHAVTRISPPPKRNWLVQLSGSPVSGKLRKDRRSAADDGRGQIDEARTGTSRRGGTCNVCADPSHLLNAEVDRRVVQSAANALKAAHRLGAFCVDSVGSG